jgi:hypothetical protein
MRVGTLRTDYPFKVRNCTVFVDCHSSFGLSIRATARMLAQRPREFSKHMESVPLLNFGTSKSHSDEKCHASNLKRLTACRPASTCND